MVSEKSGNTTDRAIAEKGSAHPEALVSTEWLAQHLGDPNIRILESDEDVLLYDTGPAFQSGRSGSRTES